MDIRVTGRNVQVRDDVKSAIDTKLDHLSQIVSGMERADVVFKEERNPRLADQKESVEITLEGHGHHVRAKATARTQMAAVDEAIDKLGKQLRKLKTRLKRQKVPNRKRSTKPAATMVVEPELISEEPETPPVRIVKTKSFELTRMTPEEAIDRMRLLEHTFFIFTSDETARPCVVYEREDGDVGLINADS
ncbi:MAG: ribosome-associated translation inhibitor RaiA [Actinomycetota bacterium]